MAATDGNLRAQCVECSEMLLQHNFPLCFPFSNLFEKMDVGEMSFKVQNAENA